MPLRSRRQHLGRSLDCRHPAPSMASPDKPSDQRTSTEFLDDTLGSHHTAPTEPPELLAPQFTACPRRVKRNKHGAKGAACILRKDHKGGVQQHLEQRNVLADRDAATRPQRCARTIGLPDAGDPDSRVGAPSGL